MAWGWRAIATPFFVMKSAAARFDAIRALSPVLLVGFLLVEWAWPGTSARFREFPFLLSLVFLGMPHGAQDLARIWESAGERRLAPTALHFVPYLIIIGITTAAIISFPLLSLAGFALVSIWHFGRSDYENRPAFWLARGICRGTLVLSIPIVASPAVVLDLSARWIEVLGDSSRVGELTARWESLTHLASAALFASIFTWFVVQILLLRRREFASVALESAETLTLVAALAWLDPVFGVGAWFLCWHSLRHLLLHEGSTAEPREPLLVRWTGIGPRSLPLLLPTLGIYLLVAWTVIGGWEPFSLVALLLIFFAAVTPAHEWLDWRLESIRQKESTLNSGRIRGDDFPATSSANRVANSDPRHAGPRTTVVDKK